ncbi:MAG: hypothetical protein HYX68_02035 [Planctomycetes bacterium]|nr:hypothetical protein [Planctomycetota bacterium]
MTFPRSFRVIPWLIFSVFDRWPRLYSFIWLRLGRAGFLPWLIEFWGLVQMKVTASRRACPGGVSRSALVHRRDKPGGSRIVCYPKFNRFEPGQFWNY